MTGLYNRRGFDSISQEMFDKAKKEKKDFMIVAVDMDNLKMVNDRFGHMNGDLALKTIGDAMQAVANEADACARVGGDEYNIIGLGYTDEDAEKLIRRFDDYLECFNQNSELPYLIKASLGYSIVKYGQDVDLEACIHEADARLYEYKRKKKQQKKDCVLR